MQRSTAIILLVACLALLGMQVGGLHAHADSHGFHGEIQSAHGHHHEHDHDGGGEHGDEVDVQLVDFGISTSKALFLALAVCLTLFLLPPARSRLLFDRAARLPVRQRLRWRPPLRGPPHLAHTA